MTDTVWTCLFLGVAFIAGMAAGYCIGIEKRDENTMAERVNRRLIQIYAEYHMSLCENWEEGAVDVYWKDEAGNVCIRYKSGKWFHYSRDSSGKIIYW